MTKHYVAPLAVFVALASALPFASAQAQSAYDTGRAAWRGGDYQQAYVSLLDYRTQPYGRRPDVDFMLGTSGCRLEGRRTWGAEVLDWMLYAYALTYKSRQIVVGERDLCRQASMGQLVDTEIDEIVEERAAGMTGYGKTFYWAEREQQPVASYPIRRLRDIPKATFAARRIPLGDEEDALRMVQELSPGGRIEVHGNLILVSEMDHSSADLSSISQTLNRFIGFLRDSYGIEPPPYYLTVYLVESSYDVRQRAEQLHGLDVSAATVGYTFVDDGSVVAAVSGTAIGTALHEMFHLLVRAHFGDIPQWLDEGLAALYEVSGRRGDHYFGLANWRGRVLESLWHARPTVDELIRTEWFLFDDPAQAEAVERSHEYLEGFLDESEGQRQAAMMAFARYFLLYLEQRGELAPVFRAVRDEGFATLEGDARDHAVHLVETTLGRSTADLDAEFVGWFQSGGPERAASGPILLKSGGAAYVADTRVNVRSGPSTDHERLGQLAKGEKVAVFGEASGWYELRYSDGTAAYVSGRYLSRAGGN